MTQYLEIEGNLVRTIERTVLKETALPDMLEHLERRPPIMLPLLPRNTLASLYWDESEAPTKIVNLAFTMPPAIRLLPLDPSYVLDGIEPSLAMPWTVFVFSLRVNQENPAGQDWTINDVRFYFSRDELNGETDNLIHALLPNVYTNANICWGDTGVPARQPLRDRIDQTINEFYQTTFSHGGDIQNNWPGYRTTYRKWAKQTEKIGRLCYRDWPDWTDERRTHLSLKDALRITVDVKVPLILQDRIPNLIVTPSFLRAEEWLKDLSQDQRHRLHVAFNNILADNAHAADRPEGLPPVLDAGDDQDDEEE